MPRLAAPTAVTRRRSRPTTAIGLVLFGISVCSCAPDGGVSTISAQPIEPDDDRSADPTPTSAPPRPAPTDTSPDTAPEPSPDTTAEPDPESDPEPAPFDAVVLRPVDLAEVAEVGDAKVGRTYDEIVAATILDLEDWFAAEHPRLHDEAWQPLRGGVWPSYPGRTDLPGCGQATTDPDDVSDYVAFYCAGRDFLVYDDGPDSLLGQLATEFGPVVLAVVLAHEYGHVVQERLGDLDRRLPTILTEQQADCVAGAWVARALEGRSPHIRLGQADVRGALVTMVAVRDPVGIDQFLPGGHGSAFDRVGAFQAGFADDLDRCVLLLDDPLPLMPNAFLSTTDLINDGDLPFGYGPGDIVPVVERSLNAYWSFAVEELTTGRPSHDAAAIGFPTIEITSVTTMVDGSADPSTGCVVGPITEIMTGLWLCADDASVLVDDELARRIYRDPILGAADFAVGYLLGLAWAELAQQMLDSDLAGAERALANDCLVGAWARDLDPFRPDRPGEVDRIVISPGDLDEAVVAAIELSDARPGSDRLGLPLAKIDVFRRGVLDGLQPCLELISR